MDAGEPRHLRTVEAHAAQKYESKRRKLWSPKLSAYDSKIDYVGYHYRGNVDYHYCIIAKGSNTWGDGAMEMCVK